MCIGLAARGERGTPMELQAVASATLRAMVRGSQTCYVKRIRYLKCKTNAMPGEFSRAALRNQARRGVGVEVLPIGNAMLNQGNLSYYQEFVKHGVCLFVGTDDPGFTSANLNVEVAATHAAVQGRL